MNYDLVFRKRAENHITTSFEWYEKRKIGLGNEFILSLEAVFSAIKRNPLHFQLRFKDIRCEIAPRFPFGVFYFIDESKNVVVSVFHLKRDQKNIK